MKANVLVRILLGLPSSFKRRTLPAGRDSLRAMTDTSGRVWPSVADGESLDDVLSFLVVGRVNRVTAAVFQHFNDRARSAAPPAQDIPIQEAVLSLVLYDAVQLLAAIQALLAVNPDSNGRWKGSYGSVELWLVPNDDRGLTLTFPENQ